MNSGLGAIKKWVGIATALISFGGVLYGLIHSASDGREQKRVFQEQFKSGQAQEAAGDFAGALDRFTYAEATVADQGVFSKLLGSLNAEQREVRTAEQDLAMNWLRGSWAQEGAQSSTFADPLLSILTAGASSAGGERKADLLAHLGWAYFLKRRAGDGSLHPETAYSAAVAADPKNPYANAFWGHWILWNHGPLKDANDRFAAALSTERARGVVRQFQLAALANARSNDSDAAWLRAVSDMQVGGEKADSSLRDEVCNLYAQALHDGSLNQQILAQVPASRQIELLRSALQSEGLSEAQKTTLNVALAESLEAAGRPANALEVWKALASELKTQPSSIWSDRVDAAIERLSRKCEVFRRDARRGTLSNAR